MTTINIEYQDGEVRAAFNRLLQAVASPAPLLKSIGERVSETTKRRFDSTTAPDGGKWKPNSQAVYLNLRWARSDLRKDGRLGAQGAQRAMGKKPLTGETGSLRATINYQIQADAVLVGSPMEYARIQQLGGTVTAKNAKSLFFTVGGHKVFVKSVTLPARPFLGISTADEADIIALVNAYLSGANG